VARRRHLILQHEPLAQAGGGRRGLDLHRASFTEIVGAEEGLRRPPAEGVIAVIARDDDVVARNRAAELVRVVVVLGEVVAKS
jgi:hypothetical protein